MGMGKIVGFDQADIAAHRAVGVRPLTKARMFDLINDQFIWLVREIDDIQQGSFKLTLACSEEEFKDNRRYFQLSNTDQDFFGVVPVDEQNPTDPTRYCLVFRQRSISLLSVASRLETKLVQQTSFREEDCMSRGYCTGKIPNVKIHYIETKTKLDKNTNMPEYRSYCVFFLREDFWDAMD